ncbi:MAG: ABC transporter substrate-binding protein, partial [Planctomycetes bacterium]|nr:ABC transporter substrate-binding protein [Planctomycetota bacterium]
MNGFRRFLATVLAVAALVGAAAPGVYAEEEQPVWQSNDDYEPVGDPAAVEGGTIVDVWLEYPSTLRTEGPNSNTMANSQIHGFIYESLIGLHSATLQYVPGLANKWAISKDKRTFWYKIDPRAKWADGSPVTADDVVATWEHMTDPKISDPYANFLYGESYEKPVAIDAQTVRVTTKKLNWRLFLYIGGMAIYPAKEIRIPGDKYIDEFQWKLQMGSGPYTLKMEDVKKDESLTLTKRP